jgi:hypothetical protein
MVDLQKVQPVEYRKEDLQAAMEIFAEHVAEVIQHQTPKLRVRLASTDPMVEEYLAWCGRRNAAGDCLELLDAKSPGISESGKRSIAVRMALGTALEEVASAVRHVDPMKVEALLLIWFTIYFASFVFPDATITKALAFVMSANMVAFLGWDGFRSFVLGYRDMCKAADAAQTFAALYDAGRAYGNRMGPSMVRIVTTLVTLGLSAATGMSVPVNRLPGGPQAVANGEAMGFRLSAVSGGSIAVGATGAITIVLANGQPQEQSLPADGQQHVTFPEKRAGHIFRPEKGHLKDTPANRKLLVDLAEDAGARLGTDRFGNVWSARTNADGSQVWVETRNGEIINGGLNASPRTFNPQTGLSAPAPLGG